MITTLKFKLPEEDGELKMAQRGAEFYCAILEIRKSIRAHNKYGMPMREAFEEIEVIANDVNTEDIP
jgi:hypothetical protein